MKKKFFLFLFQEFRLSASMLVPAWKRIKLRSRPAVEVAFDELTNRIAALDMQYVGSDPQTRGRFRNFFKRLVGCDTGGAALMRRIRYGMTLMRRRLPNDADT